MVIEEAASKHPSTLKIVGFEEDQGAKWKPRATPLNFLQMVTTKDPRPKLARVVIDLKPAWREELLKAKSASAAQGSQPVRARDWPNARAGVCECASSDDRWRATVFCSV